MLRALVGAGLGGNAPPGPFAPQVSVAKSLGRSGTQGTSSSSSTPSTNAPSSPSAPDTAPAPSGGTPGQGPNGENFQFAVDNEGNVKFPKVRVTCYGQAAVSLSCGYGLRVFCSGKAKMAWDGWQAGAPVSTHARGKLQQVLCARHTWSDCPFF